MSELVHMPLATKKAKTCHVDQIKGWETRWCGVQLPRHIDLYIRGMSTDLIKYMWAHSADGAATIIQRFVRRALAMIQMVAEVRCYGGDGRRAGTHFSCVIWRGTTADYERNDSATPAQDLQHKCGTLSRGARRLVDLRPWFDKAVMLDDQPQWWINARHVYYQRYQWHDKDGFIRPVVTESYRSALASEFVIYESKPVATTIRSVMYRSLEDMIAGV